MLGLAGSILRSTDFRLGESDGTGRELAATTAAAVITSLTLRRNMDISTPSVMTANRDTEVTTILARPTMWKPDALAPNALAPKSATRRHGDKN